MYSSKGFLKLQNCGTNAQIKNHYSYILPGVGFQGHMAALCLVVCVCVCVCVYVLRNLHAILHISCTNLHSHWQCRISSLFSTPSPAFSACEFLQFYWIIYFGALGLHCWVQAFSSCCEQGLLFAIEHGPLFAVAWLVAEHRIWSTQASLAAAGGLQLLHCTWDLLRSGSKPMFPALAGRFLSTEPPGKFLFVDSFFFLFFYDSHSGWCEVISHCRFDLHFSKIYNVDRLFMCLLAISVFS